MKKVLRLTVVLLCAAFLLTGCKLVQLRDSLAHNVADTLQQAIAGDDKTVKYSDMVYTRPDMEQLDATLDAAVSAAAGDDSDRILQKVFDFYDAYDSFYTNYSLADIRYSADLTDSHWESEYDFCSRNAATVDASLEELYYALAKAPCLEQLEEDYFGQGFFDSYQGENLWDGEFTALLEQESDLISRYYELRSSGADYSPGSEDFYRVCGNEMIDLLIDLIQVRHQIADYWGYDSYNDFATEFYHYRDYSVHQSREYLQQVARELAPLYRTMNESDIWSEVIRYASEASTYDYVRQMAQAMGGNIQEAFLFMDRAGVYDISYSPNKYASSFEVYLTSYQSPFIFLCPSLDTTDHLTFAHEFGHFCNDYASRGSYAGVDILEVFSQGMEFLSLFYTDENPDLARLKMADSLCIYVEQSAYASFEMGMYDIPPEELTPEALTALYEEVALKFGFESIGYDPREFVHINHFYTNPLYVLSYVVSNDAAMQLYQLEAEADGAGLTCLEANLATEEYYLLAFLENAGLESPFAPGRLQSVRDTFRAFFSE